MFIVFEGGDSTGKSTLSKVLADRLGAVHMVTPPESYKTTRDKIDREATPQAKYEYYKAGTLAAAEEIRKYRAEGRTVVIDRYWLTTYIYHELIGVPVSRDHFDGIIQPDLTILPALNNEIQLSRMHKRGLSIRDQQMLDKQKAITALFYQRILDFKIPYFGLDTHRFNQSECLEICLHMIYVASLKPTSV